MMGFSRISPKSVYVGLPLFWSSQIKDLVEQLDSKLVCWKARTLSKAKKLVLIKYVALALPIYVMQTTQIPVSICSKLNNRIRSFWWGSPSNGRKTLCLKAWDAL